MKKIIQQIIFVTLLFTSGANYGQDQDNISLQPEKKQKNAVTLYGGFPGMGIGYSRELNEHLSLRIKGSYFNFSILKQGLTLGSRVVDLDVAFKYSTFDLLLDYLPFKKSSFKIVGGLSYLTPGKLDILIRPAGDMKYGDMVIPQNKIGAIKSGADWSGLTPYLALGFGRAVPKNKVGFGFEMGGYFVGKPTVIFDASKMLAPTIDEKDQFETWMNKFAFIPSLMFHVNYKF